MQRQRGKILRVKCEDILNKEVLLGNKGILDGDVTKKLKDLNHPIDCESEDKPFKIFVSEVIKLHLIFEKLKIQEFSIQKQQSLENELKQLELSQYRHGKDGKALTEKHQKAAKVVEAKKAEINTLRKEIGEATKSAIENEADYTTQGTKS
jgi:hypothetical protein